MKTQLDNALTTSLMLAVDHQIQRQGQAFVNRTGLFYKDKDEVQGLYTYTCSYKQLCNDVSVSGANVMSGVYVNSVYTPVGSGGLVNINHYDGSISFNHSLPANTVISGSFGVKDFSVYLSDQLDYKVVLDSKYHINPKYSQQATGIPLDTKSMPAVILVPKDQEARPFAFAGLDDNYMKVRGIVVCENVFQRIAVCNILKNFRLKPLPIFYNVPFDYLGNMTGLNYNYTGLNYNQDIMPIILSAKTTQIPNNLEGGFSDISRQYALVDFEISAWGGHQ